MQASASSNSKINRNTWIITGLSENLLVRTHQNRMVLQREKMRACLLENDLDTCFWGGVRNLGMQQLNKLILHKHC
jgi:hypothetical protein